MTKFRLTNYNWYWCLFLSFGFCSIYSRRIWWTATDYSVGRLATPSLAAVLLFVWWLRLFNGRFRFLFNWFF